MIPVGEDFCLHDNLLEAHSSPGTAVNIKTGIIRLPYLSPKLLSKSMDFPAKNTNTGEKFSLNILDYMIMSISHESIHIVLLNIGEEFEFNFMARWTKEDRKRGFYAGI